MPVPILVGVSGKVHGQCWPVTAAGLRIGRQPGNEIWIDDTGVSRQHARVVLHDGVLWLQDMGSRNGVFANGSRVVGQRQLAVGDRIVVGGHTLEVRAEDPAHPGQPTPATAAPPDTSPPAARPAAPRRWRLWPFALAAGVALVFVVAVVASGRNRVRRAAPAPADPVADLLLSTSENEPAATPAPPPATAAADMEALLGEEPASATPAIPPAPAGVTAAELVERGHQYYNVGKLHDALVAYTQAGALDPACEICTRRINRLNTEIARAITEQFDAGLRAYNNLQYDQAIHAWETVLLLSPDPGRPAYQEASVYLEEARAKVRTQY